MQGTIDVAAIMARQRPQSPQPEPSVIVHHRQTLAGGELGGDRSEWLEKQRLRAMQRVYSEYFTALYADDQATMNAISREYPDLLEEAMERKRGHDQWLKKIHAPRVTAWKRRLAARQARRAEEESRRELGTVRWLAGEVIKRLQQRAGKLVY